MAEFISCLEKWREKEVCACVCVHICVFMCTKVVHLRIEARGHPQLSLLRAACLFSFETGSLTCLEPGRLGRLASEAQ